MKSSPPIVSREIVDQASDWFVRLRDADVRPEQCEEFADWLRVSPQHVCAYLDVARLWGDAAHLSRDGDAQLQALLAADDASTNVVPIAQARSDAASRTERTPASIEPNRARAGRIAAVVALGVSAAGALTWIAQDRDLRYVTRAGELHVMTLADGSIVRLNSRSEVIVRFSPEQRLVELREGQALFEVAKNSARPFVVQSGRTSVRAVGTQFDVNRKRSATVITVVEGRVAVSSDTQHRTGFVDALSWRERRHSSVDRPVGAAGGITLLTAGERVRIGAGGTISAPAPADVAAAMSWLQHEIVFDNESLETVIEELNRYLETPIVLAEPSLATLRVNAVLQTTSAESLLRFVSRLDGVRVERGEAEIRITRTH